MVDDESREHEAWLKNRWAEAMASLRRMKASELLQWLRWGGEPSFFPFSFSKRSVILHWCGFSGCRDSYRWGVVGLGNPTFYLGPFKLITGPR